MIQDHHPELPLKDKKVLQFQWEINKKPYMITHLITANTDSEKIFFANKQFLNIIAPSNNHTPALNQLSSKHR